MSALRVTDRRAVKVLHALGSEQKITQSGESREVQILALGLPRCATSSLQAVFESEWLGIQPVHHMTEVMPDGSKRKLVLDAAHERDQVKRRKIIAELLRGYAVVTDLPLIAFSKDLLDMYPDAKIVLNQRSNGNAWAKSFAESIGFFQKKSFYFITMWFKMAREAHHIIRSLWQVASSQINKPDPYFGGDPNFGPVEFYDAWQEHIRAEAKMRNRPVLEWQPQHGWKPLCEFLGKPVPPEDVPFPRMNETAEILKVKWIMYGLGYLSWATAGAVLLYILSWTR
ncbi:hypothetical protein BX600DRAFT_517599 [Xylariales sp. PMI_506]|nr:hypothetical protein BX600DRAFT_517599 [Xylariales sp. PMI_506]